MDSHGRVFYIDHNTRTTTWQRPTSTVTDDPVEEHRRQLDRRLLSLSLSHGGGGLGHVQSEQTELDLHAH